MANTVAKKISKELAASKKYPNGTVVRFRWTPTYPPNFGYSYVAIFIEATNRWYLSGRAEGQRYIMSSEEFLDFLNKCTDIYVATEWEAVEQ